MHEVVIFKEGIFSESLLTKLYQYSGEQKVLWPTIPELAESSL